MAEANDRGSVRPVVLCVLDGWGERPEEAGNAIRLAETPELSALRRACPVVLLGASGSDVGLPAGTPGNGEAGHLSLGTGRIVPSGRCRVDEAIRSRRFVTAKMIDQTMRIADYDKRPLHLIGLLSDGGVHSSLDHLLALLDLADFHEIPVIVHAVLDGRDVPPRSAQSYLDKLQFWLEDRQGKIGTLSGRYYAMDRERQWDRTYQAFHAIVRDVVLGPEAPRAESPLDALYQSYAQGLDDEHVVPVRIGDYQGINGDFMCDFASAAPVWEWTGEEVGLGFNCRGDGLWQLVSMLTRKDLPAEVAADLLVDRNKPVLAFQEHMFASLTECGQLDIPVGFPREVVEGSLGELLAAAGLRQLRVAEAQRAAQVTSFFNGGRPEPFPGEERVIVAPRWDLDPADRSVSPALRAAELTAAVLAAIDGGTADFILVSYANGDMLGHTGDLAAAQAAVQVVDEAVGRLAAAVRRAGGCLLVTSDHGNCETMIGEDGAPHRGHTTNPVPLIYLNERDEDVRLRAEGGRLCDVAPTVLELLGLDPPEAMEGRSLRLPRAG